ncbi:MAG: hypothetical protein A3C02_01080 [Candidatus Andersenbacteria bacterium RIFCSPHIGHO2_02_FULL_45_11]|uniref:NADP-dependent oxidoreductase domain-containing protein n=1 Tax=Candidatus Andersenbacteria bacterium RIFCSPHIGHO2_12_FULL_45_11 TaxID=1797281 RepID=A0A1G1X1L4_9BACT|nr:MAG: hypothetical protein A2805_04080 [Candidatus Andersenbacteria bacterium RIFCSPHIGHO2_01_FULL_46_36]OGY33575.1 MAG: hypothetical protein A3C02_01080 [Candidatus Andersenbacteria bacterium RIFCSPHIGHO2_02_FULL_45_11]OGY33863.1 MAG: hypothetical protein A3D99_03960 [Candidatus Andersenbacteria bacterium RIFCSPHIGHO2_12_FULL_45_11]
MNFSRIGLGTVEIGLPYGIGATTLPSNQEAEHILKSAVEMGVTYIDTARGYGVAEERIGKSGIGMQDNVIVGTKCGQFLQQEPDLHGKELEMRIREDIDTSRKKLQQESLQLVQFHNEREDYTDFSEIIEIIQKLKDEQKVQHVGVSTRGEEAALAAIETGFFETIQIAYSILDQRMAARVLPGAQEKGIAVLNRSVLLKGALSPGRVHLHANLTPLKEAADKAEKIATTLGISLPELAIRFAASNPAISTVLIGTIKPEHLESAIRAAEREPLPQEVIAQCEKLGFTDPLQVDPAKWPK